MPAPESVKSKVLIVTGFAPVKLPQLVEMGIPTGPITFLSALAGKETLRFSIPTVAPAVLGRYLVERGINVRIVDYYFDTLDASDADIVGISSTFMGVEDVSQIAGTVRKQNPEAKIVLGGPLSWSLSPEQLLRMVPNLDYIVLREGERTFTDLVYRLDNGLGLEPISNLAFLRDGTLVQTPAGPPLESREIAQPDWSLMGVPSRRRLPVLPVETSRGCPFNCAYCSEVNYWGKPVRYRSIGSVVSELRHNVEKLGISTFRFTDSCFSAPPARCAELCEAIYTNCHAQGVAVKWSSYARISNLDYALLGKMQRSGCVALDIGVESGSEKMLRSMGRDYAPQKAVEIAGAARELGIVTNFNMVIGFPGETSDTVQATAELIERAAPDAYACFMFFLAPHTRIEQSHADYKLEGSGLNWRHATMTSEEARESMAAMEASISSSANFPGGEYFACYLTSLGYSVAEIKNFYKAITRLAKSPGDGEAFDKIGEVVESVRAYW